MATESAEEVVTTGQPRLRRNLTVWEAIGISMALMAPSMAASINPQGTATTVGRAVPVAFALAFVGVLLVAYTGQTTVRRWEIIIPVLGVIVLGCTLFRNIWPLPSGIARWGPSVAIAWFVIGIVWVLARPAATRKAGEMLLRADGLTTAAAEGS
jgi:hypothetical protein